MKRIVLSALAAALLVSVWFESAEAIPAFARRYRLSCKTCHNPFPRLTEFGEDFAGNGFQLPDEPEPARSFADVGDEKLNLLRDFPVAARIDLVGQYAPDEGAVEYDFQFPFRAKLLSGGAIFKDIAYYFYFYMNEKGEVAGVEDCYIHFNNLFGKELDFFAGQFQVSDPLFMRELRLTHEDYHIYALRVGDSSVNLGYDRGLMLSYSPTGGTDLVLELLNGNGLGEAGEDDKFDDDSFKNVFFRAGQDLVEGLRVGGFYYFGRQTNADITNESKLWGFDSTYDYKGILTVNAQYVMRSDGDPFFSGRAAGDTETSGGLVEVVYGPKGTDSDHYFIFLYNKIDSDLDVHDYETAAFNASYMILRNMRLFGEYMRDIEREDNVLTAGLVFAF